MRFFSTLLYRWVRVVMAGLTDMVQKNVRHGRLSIIFPNGEEICAGDPDSKEDPIQVCDAQGVKKNYAFLCTLGDTRVVLHVWSEYACMCLCVGLCVCHWRLCIVFPNGEDICAGDPDSKDDPIQVSGTAHHRES